MKYKFFIYDSFTEKKFGGNQAGIVLDSDGLTENKMKKIAAEFNFSEIAFISESKNEKAFKKVRFFTPSEEVNLCGHATIAYVKCFIDEKILILRDGVNKLLMETNLGLLEILIEVENNILKNIIMEQDEGKIENIDKKYYEKIMQAMNLTLDDLDEQIEIVKAYSGIYDLMIPLKNKNKIYEIEANLDLMKEISKELDIISFHPFFFDKEKNTAYVRNFAPIVNINEEAATGTSNGALAFYLHKIGKLKENKILISIQGENMNRKSEIKSKIQNKKIFVGGNAIKILDGNLEI